MGWSLPFTAVISARRADAKLPRPKRRCHLREAGNVFMMLFGAVAMVGVIGAATMTVMKGPVRTMSMVTKRTIAENNMIAAGKLALIAAASQTNNDCDGDLYVEPLPFGAAIAGFTGGGELPTQIGVAKQDPWGSLYVYCAWDHGPTIDDPACGGATQNRLQGTNAETEFSLAIISAGPNGVYSTTCNDFVDANSDNIPDIPLVEKTTGSDDIVLGYTYAEAGSLSGGLWGLQDPNTAEINKNLSVKDTGGTEQFAFDAGTKTLTIGGTGEFPSIKTDFLSALTGGGDISVLSPISSSADITTTGNVGIGTAAPANKLEVAGGAGSDLAIAALGKIIINQGAGNNNYIVASTDGAAPTMDFYAGTAKKLVLGYGANASSYFNTGNVGIGTPTPSVRLHVRGDNDSMRLSSETAASLYEGLTFYDSAGTRSAGIRAHTSAAGNGTYANDLEIWSESGDTVFSIGNVGIGTTTPGAKLDVAGGIKHGNDAGACNAGKAGTIRWNGTAFEGCDGTSWAAIGGSSAAFETITATLSGANGGTASASCSAGYTLQSYAISQDHRTQSGINGWTNGGTLRCNNAGGTLTVNLTDYSAGSPNTLVACKGLCVKAGSGGGGGGGSADNLGNHIATQDLDLSTFKLVGNGGSAGISVGATGNVGIGTAVPGQKLEVVGNVLATAYFHSSDARLKMDIEPINGIEILDQLQGVRYRWKKDGRTAAGILAQDVEKVMPYAVTEDKNGMKAVDYDQLIAPLIEAVKAQQDQINSMRRELDALKAE